MVNFGKKKRGKRGRIKKKIRMCWIGERGLQSEHVQDQLYYFKSVRASQFLWTSSPLDVVRMNVFNVLQLVVNI